MDSRRPTRNIKPVDYTKFTQTLYPEAPPSTELDRKIHQLNQEAFLADNYAHIDDVLVYAMFGTKRRDGSYFAFRPHPIGPRSELKKEDGISMAGIITQYITSTNPTREECQLAASKLRESFASVFDTSDLPLMVQ
jgi:hypothetical protein